MPSPAEGAVGSLDYTKEERRKLAERSRREVPEFGASPERRELVRRVHAAMMRKWEDSQASARKGQNDFPEKNAEGAGERESEEVSDDASVEMDGDGSAAAASDATTERLNETSVATNAIETNATLAATLGSEADALLTRPETLNPSAGPSEEGAREGARADVRALESAEREPSEEGADEVEADDTVSASEEEKKNQPSDSPTETTTTVRLGASANDSTEDVPGAGAFLSAEPSPGSARVPVPPRDSSPIAPVDETPSSGGRETSASASAVSDASGSGSVSAGPLRDLTARTAGRPRRRRAEDSPEVTRLKQKLDVAAAFLLFAIAAILARRFLAHVKSGDEF